MKKLILNFFLLFAILSFAFTLSSFVTNTTTTIHKENSAGYLMVRVYESAAKHPESKIVIINEEGSVKNVSLEMWSAKTLENNFKKIHTELSKIKDQGYTLISTSGGPNAYGIITTYIFQK